MTWNTRSRVVHRWLRGVIDGAGSTDARGVTFTVSYVLTLGITVLLVAGVLITAGQVVQDQRELAIEDEATVVGDEVAASVMAADRLARDGSDAEVTVGVDLPRTLADRPYTIELTADAIVVETTSPQVRVEVPLRSETEIRPETVAGGDLRVVYQSDTEPPSVTIEAVA